MNVLKMTRFGKKLGHIVFRLLRLVLMCGIAYYILYPILVKCLGAFMSVEDMYDTSVGILPRHWTLDNITAVLDAIRFPAPLMNSVVLCVVSVITQVVSCTLVGYGFARFEFRGKKLLFAAVILVIVVPAEVIITPLYLNYRFFDVFGIVTMVRGEPLNLLDSIWPFIVGGFTCMGLRCGLYIYLLRQFYRSVPKELEDAAAIDGAGYFTTFLRVMLPMGRSMIFVVAILSLVWGWTDSFYPNWYYQSRDVLATAMSRQIGSEALSMSITGNKTFDPNLTFMVSGIGTLLISAPLLVVYAVTNKNLIGGIERSGMVE